MSDEHEGVVVLCGGGLGRGREIDRVPEKCPCCGGELTTGYGLAGGGCGVYVACLDCEYFVKAQDRGNEEGLGPWVEFRPEGGGSR